MASLAMLALLGLLPACAKKSERLACPAGSKCLDVSNTAEPFTLDPSKAQLLAEANVINDLMIGLTTLNAAGQAIPGMATNWEVSPDGLVWTFHLRDAKWSDGVPVTAADFVFALHRLEDPKTAATYAYLLYLIEGAKAVNLGKAPPESMGVRALDPHTLELRLTHPAPYLPQLLTHLSAYPLPAHAIEKWGDAWARPGRYVSNGPYMLVDWKLGDHITLRANPHFWDRAALCYDDVRYYPASDPVSAERQVANGQLDMVDSFASNRAPYLRKHMPGYVHTAPTLAIAYLAVNAAHVPALGDRRVREALSMAIDRNFMADKLMRAGQVPSFAFVPPETTNYPGIAPPPWSHWSLERRQEGARKLLAEAGYGPRNPLKLDIIYSLSGDNLLATTIQSDLRTIGVDLQISPEEGQIMFADMRARNFQLAVVSWYADFDDATTFLQLFASDAGAQNYAEYNNPRYDALLAKAGQTRDAIERGKVLAEAEATAMKDWPVIPLYVNASRTLLRPGITGFKANALNMHPKRFFCPVGAQPRPANPSGPS